MAALEDMAVLEVTDWEVLEVTDWDTGSAMEDTEVMVDTALGDMALDMAMAVLAIMGRGQPMTMIISEKRGILRISINLCGKLIRNHETPGQHRHFWEAMGASVAMGLEAWEVLGRFV